MQDACRRVDITPCVAAVGSSSRCSCSPLAIGDPSAELWPEDSSSTTTWFSPSLSPTPSDPVSRRTGIEPVGVGLTSPQVPPQLQLGSQPISDDFELGGVACAEK